MERKHYKKLFRIFTIADFEAEETFLREQHKIGWKLIKFTIPGFFTFESCTPEDVIYQLDFNDIKTTDKSSYLQMFTDYGWEYLGVVNGFSYFRKSAANSKPEDLEIFSDKQSRIERIQKITYRRIIPLCVIFFCILLPQFFSLSSRCAQSSDWSDWLLLGIFFVLFILYTMLFIHCGITFFRLKKKYLGE